MAVLAPVRPPSRGRRAPRGLDAGALVRDPDGKFRALPHRAAGAQLPAQPLDQVVDDRKPDPRAFHRARPGAVDAVEALKEVGHLLRGDANARVPDDQLGVQRQRVQLHGDLALKGKLKGVGEQVRNDLLPQAAVHPDRRQVGAVRDVQAQPGRLDRAAKGAGDIGREGAEVGGLEVGHLRAASRPARSRAGC